MLLSALVDRYELSHDIKSSSAAQLRWTVRGFDKFLERPATVEDLDPDAVNRHLKSLRDAGKADTTVKNRRGNLLTIWRAAKRMGLTKARPKGVRKIRLARAAPVAWTQDEVTRLLRTAAVLPGKIRGLGLSAARWWSAFILLAWDTGLRRCDLLAMRHSDIRSGWVVVVQAKTGQTIHCRLHDATLAAIKELGTEGKVLPWRGMTAFYRHFSALMKAAGLTGKPKWLRRSSGTAVELAHPGQGGRHLGHLTPGMAERHYLDPAILARAKPMPPPLAG